MAYSYTYSTYLHYVQYHTDVQSTGALIMTFAVDWALNNNYLSILSTKQNFAANYKPTLTWISNQCMQWENTYVNQV